MEHRQREIDAVAGGIDELKVEFERFFNGALPTPPERLRDRVRASLRRLQGRPGLSAVDRFRLTQLEARFNSYNELFNRRTRELEEGGRPRPGDGERPGLDLGAGVEVGREVASEVAEALYQGLCADDGSPRFDLDSFRSYLDQQNNEIRRKTGCEKVRFRLIREAGKTKLKAKPLGSRPGNGATEP